MLAFVCVKTWTYGEQFQAFFFSAACNRDSSGDVEFTDQRECWLYDVLMLYGNHFWAIVSEKLTGLRYFISIK